MTVAFRDDVDRMTIGELRKYVGDLEMRLQDVSQAAHTRGLDYLIAAFGLTPSEATLLGELSDGRIHRKSDLLNAVSWQKDEPPEIKIVDVWMCRIRKKIAGSGVEVGTVWGAGYQVENPALLQSVMRGEPLPPFTPNPVEQRFGRLRHTYGAKHGAVRDAVLGFLRALPQDNKGRVVAEGRALVAAVPGAQSASSAIRNLERAGHLEVVKPGRARGRSNDPWVVRLK